MDREGLKALRPSLAGARCIADIPGDRCRRGARYAARRLDRHHAGRRPAVLLRRSRIRWPSAACRRARSWTPRLRTTRCASAQCSETGGAPPRLHGAEQPGRWPSTGSTAGLHLAAGGVEIVRDDAGLPTGVIIEHNPRPTAELDLLPAVPRFGYADRLEGLCRSMQVYNAAGTTSVYEGHGLAAETIAAYRALWERGRDERACGAGAEPGVERPLRGPGGGPRLAGLRTRARYGRSLAHGLRAYTSPSAATLWWRSWRGPICRTPAGPASSSRPTRSPSSATTACWPPSTTCASTRSSATRLADVLPVLEAVDEKVPLAERRWGHPARGSHDHRGAAAAAAARTVRHHHPRLPSVERRRLVHGRSGWR